VTGSDLASSPLERVRTALDAGDVDAARAALDRYAAGVLSLQHFSVQWVTSLLSFVAHELGEPAVERALRATGEEFVLPRRAEFDELPLPTRVRAIVEAMLTNGGGLEAMAEDADGVTLSFRCGSGGRLVDEGWYDDAGGPFATLRESGPMTFGRPALPVYCAHCSVHNELMPLERGMGPSSVEEPTPGPGGLCVHRVFRDPRGGVPAPAYERLGLSQP
jgi:hypothetical protein